MRKLIKRIAFLLIFSCQCISHALCGEKGDVVIGAERSDKLETLLQGRKIGLVVNQTSVLNNELQTHLLDFLVESGYQVKVVFAPEHGFRGTEDAGEEVKDSKDIKTGIPIVSIYGKQKAPTAGQLAEIDAVVFDIQDVGARFYTYISTMHYVMEACAENGKELIVLDRPNPNDYVDGPIRQPGFRSFVGVDPIPLLHGLTVGELAGMINGEGWLKSGENSCKLEVVPMLNWKHGDPYWLPVKPSPNLPNDQAVRLYPSLCLFEATPFSVGRGTYFPFQVIGYPDKKFGTYQFTPAALPGFDTNPIQKDKVCYGVNLQEYPFEGGLTLKFVMDFFDKCGRNATFFFSRAKWFDLLAGTDQLRKQIAEGMSEEQIRESWKEGLEKYKEMRKKYLLYGE
ncbi:MAG TPA: DUF1343 domain-containing protein [Parabacteroides sp.]|nr:DUF1343 domain-containing protein [Parabacteroides sp.]